MRKQVPDVCLIVSNATAINLFNFLVQSTQHFLLVICFELTKRKHPTISISSCSVLSQCHHVNVSNLAITLVFNTHWHDQLLHWLIISSVCNDPYVSVLLMLWMMSCLHIMVSNRKSKGTYSKWLNRGSTRPGAESDICDRLVRIMWTKHCYLYICMQMKISILLQ